MLTKHLLNYTRFIFFLVIVSAAGKVFSETQSEKNTVNFLEINKYANFSSIAYQSAPKIRELDALKNYTITHYSNIPEIEIAYFLSTNEITKDQVIAVRGTSNVENAVVDVALQLTQDMRAGVRLHNGFSQAAQAIYAEIEPMIKEGYVISTTGHSLGGAVALILAMYLDVDGFKIGQVITFGQPKVTNVAGANKFEHLNIIRVVTPKDLVPLVPPFDPVDFNNLDIYWHPGKEVILLPGIDYAVLQGMSSMMRAIKFTQEPLNESNLINHHMDLYLDMVAKKIPSARLVSFKNSFNLFNWFGSDEK
ncbi:lipase family protein [Pseudomonadota bacterium]